MYFSLSREIEIRKLDVTNNDEIKALAAEIQDIDILFNCAGYVQSGNFLSFSS